MKLIRINKKYTLEEVFEKTLFGHPRKVGRVDFDGDKIRMDSLRLKVFKIGGGKCVRCGLQGSFYVKEKHLCDKLYHLNLYAINEMGEEVLMTKDHILPKSKGGTNRLNNLQVMCYDCNAEKGNNENYI